MKDSRKGMKSIQKRKRRIKAIILVFLVIILFVGGYAAYAFINLYKAASESYHPIERGTHSKLRKQEVTIGKNPISILLMGVENYSSGGKDGRTDTLIVITLNPDTHKMTMTSIPRDTRVPIASRDGKLDKINAAYSYGSVNGYGAVKGTIDTVENMLNIPIDYYVTVGFSGFSKVVDELGGVDVDVPFDFWEKDIFNHNQHINFKKGPMHLDGEQALAYVRMRKRDPRGDFGRNDRQRQVIKAAVSQAISANTIFKVDELSSIIGSNIETNLKPSEIYSLERTYASMDSSKIESFHLDDKGHDDTIDGIYYFVLSDQGLAEVSTQLRQELGLDAAAVTNDQGSDTTTQ